MLPAKFPSGQKIRPSDSLEWGQSGEPQGVSLRVSDVLKAPDAPDKPTDEIQCGFGGVSVAPLGRCLLTINLYK